LRWPCRAAPTACSSAAVCVVCSAMTLARLCLGERVYACVQKYIRTWACLRKPGGLRKHLNNLELFRL